MDILSALSTASVKPMPGFGAATTDTAATADGDMASLFQSILGEIAATGGDTGTIARGSPLLRQAAQAAGAVLPDGHIDIALLPSRIALGAGLDGSSVDGDGKASLDLPADLAALLEQATVPTDTPAPEGSATPATAEAGATTAIPAPIPTVVDTPTLPTAQIALAAALPSDAVATQPVADEGTSAVSSTVSTADSAAVATTAANTVASSQVPLAAAPVADAKDAKGRGTLPAGDAVPAVTPAAGTATGHAAAESATGTDAAPIPSDAAAEPAGEDAAGDADPAQVTVSPLRKGKGTVATGSPDGVAAAEATRAGTKPAEEHAEIVADKVSRREARLAVEAEATDRRRVDARPTPEAAQAAAAQSAPKPAGPQPQVQAVAAPERAIAALGSGSTASQDRGDGKSDQGRPAEILSAAATATPEAARTSGLDFAQHLANAKAARPGHHAPPAPTQVAVHIQRAAQDGLDRVSIQLRPVELGRIEVRMEFGSDGVMRAKFMAENPQTLELLQRDLRGLEKSLQDAGIRTESGGLSFSLRDDGRSAHQQQDRPGRGRGTAFTLDGDMPVDAAAPPDRTARLPAAGRVDVRV